MPIFRLVLPPNIQGSQEMKFLIAIGSIALFLVTIRYARLLLLMRFVYRSVSYLTSEITS